MNVGAIEVEIKKTFVLKKDINSEKPAYKGVFCRKKKQQHICTQKNLELNVNCGFLFVSHH